MSWKPDKQKLAYPVYYSLADLMEQDIKSGKLAANTKLPPQRELADFLDLNLSTITKAYKLCEMRGLIDRLPAEVYEADMAKMAETYDIENLPKGHMENHSRLYLALKDVMAEQHYDFAAIKCWPEMGNLHTTPCAVLGRLADDGIIIGCEGDVDAELAQMTEYYLTGEPSFITDLINIDEEKNVITFWHCGNAAPSLFNKEYEVEIRNHPLAGQGTAFYGALKPGKVTVARFCNIDGAYKLFLLSGEAVAMDRSGKIFRRNM